MAFAPAGKERGEGARRKGPTRLDIDRGAASGDREALAAGREVREILVAVRRGRSHHSRRRSRRRKNEACRCEAIAKEEFRRARTPIAAPQGVAAYVRPIDLRLLGKSC